MTQKSEKLAKRIMQNSEKEMSLEEAKNLGKLVLDSIIDETMEEGKLAIIGFGVFEKKHIQSAVRTIRTNIGDPSSPTKEVEIPERIKISFRASKKNTEELTEKYL